MSEEKLSHKTIEALGQLWDVMARPVEILATAIGSLYDLIVVKTPDREVDMIIGVDKRKPSS